MDCLNLSGVELIYFFGRKGLGWAWRFGGQSARRALRVGSFGWQRWMGVDSIRAGLARTLASIVREYCQKSSSIVVKGSVETVQKETHTPTQMQS